MTRRPSLEAGAAATEAARLAVQQLVDDLQQGVDRHDADRYDRTFADNVLWGSPFGATLQGYEPLHAVHARFQSKGVAARSRFEIEQVMVPSPGVAIAQVRRVAGGANAHEPERGAAGVPNAAAFSEMALYVLVEKDGKWWLAAGQNTPIRAEGS